MMDIKQKKSEFKSELAKKADIVNSVLAEVFTEQTDIQARLAEAMRYTLDAPGKRLRPAIVLWCCELISGSVNRAAEIAATAVEMVHTYSLVHDDLPAMDDDDMRRGKPSCHKAFDEATAILTGDGLLTFVFELLAEKIEDAQVAAGLIRILARAAGPAGMIAGQMADLEAEKAAGTLELLEYIHINKTARMFAASAEMGAVAGGADEKQRTALTEYGLAIGLGFQVTDDLLDISGQSAHLGKTAGKDAARGKVTYPAVVGVEKSREIAEELAAEAIEKLSAFGNEADILRQLPMVLLDRTR